MGREDLSPGIVGLSISYAMNVSSITKLSYIYRMFRKKMIAVEGDSFTLTFVKTFSSLASSSISMLNGLIDLIDRLMKLKVKRLKSKSQLKTNFLLW